MQESLSEEVQLAGGDKRKFATISDDRILKRTNSTEAAFYQEVFQDPPSTELHRTLRSFMPRFYSSQKLDEFQ